MNLVLNVLVGGVDTTQAQLAHGLRLFAEHPEQWELLAGDTSLARAAVEEILRYEPITPFTARVTLEDIELRDVEFPKGTVIFIAAVSANRDPAAHEDAERFDIARGGDGSRVLTFGRGSTTASARTSRARRWRRRSPTSPRASPASRSTASRRYGSVNGIYHLESLPLRWDR